MLRQLGLAAAAAAMAASCAFLDRAFAPAPNPWPDSREGRVRRDGRILRVSGASAKSLADADADAKRGLESWLWRLDLAADDRGALIDGVLNSPEAKPVPSPDPNLAGYNSLIELDLFALQKRLGTHYE